MKYPGKLMENSGNLVSQKCGHLVLASSDEKAAPSLENPARKGNNICFSANAVLEHCGSFTSRALLVPLHVTSPVL